MTSHILRTLLSERSVDCSDFKYCTGISLCKSDRENLCFIYKISKITLFVSLTIGKGSKIASLFAFFDHCQGVILMCERLFFFSS